MEQEINLKEKGINEINLQMIIPKIFIGNIIASQSNSLLKQNNIKNVISVMKQANINQQESFNYLNVPIDDTLKTNISEWFDIVSNWIQARLDDLDHNYGILIHCVAGISRSATLLAAYLMKAHKLTSDEAIGYISSKRPQVEPNEFFIHQLEMYERCNCEWNPTLYQEQRRFMMNFMTDGMKDEAGPEKLILAYYPSPAPSPRDDSMNLISTGKGTTSVEDKLNSTSLLKSPIKDHFNITSKLPIESTRRRLTKRTEPNPLNSSGSSSNSQKLQVESLGQVVIQGRRLSCKMCRRELASCEHVLVHSPGRGQAAFAPQKQDMNQFRKDQNQLEVGNGESNIEINQDKILNLRISLPPSSRTEMNHPNSTQIITTTPLSSLTPKSTSSTPLIKSEKCSSYFVEPLSWMKVLLENGQPMGKIVCPNQRCKCKLGSFDWAGSQCSCGAWITPGFQILRSKVDEF